MPGDPSEQFGHPGSQRIEEGTNAVNVSKGHSQDSPVSARRIDRLVWFPA